MPTTPAFICIGPGRTGTTWLYKMLRQHPAVWLPPLKEIRVLAEGLFYPPYSLKELVVARHWHYRLMRASLPRVFIKAVLRRESFVAFRWSLRYVLRPGARQFSFEWYSSLFKNDGNLISGDITPEYYDLPESRVNELSEYCRSIKIILFVRNPIERVWSESLKVRTDDGKSKPFAGPRKEMIELFDYFFRVWTPYEKKIALWKAYFPQVFVGRFDDLKNRPVSFWGEICDFLNIPADVPVQGLDRHVNQGTGQKNPR